MQQKFNKYGRPVGLHYGYVGKEGQIVIVPQFDMAFSFRERRARVQKRDQWYFIDPTGKRVSDMYEWVGDFSEGLAIVSRNGKRGYIDTEGRMVIDLQFDNCLRFTESMAVVQVGGKFGYIKRCGEFAIPPIYDEVMPFFGGTACVKVNGKYGQVNKEGIMTVAPTWNRFFTYHESLAAIRQGDKDGYIDADGNLVIPCRFDFGHHFSNGLARVDYEGNQGFINKGGEWVVEPMLNDAKDFHEGLAAVFLDQRWGFIDTTGSVVIEPKYRYVCSFSDGLAFVRADDRCGFINPAGEWQFDAVDDEMASFSDSLACMKVQMTAPPSGEPVRNAIRALALQWQRVQGMMETSEVSKAAIEQNVDQLMQHLELYRKELFYWFDILPRSLTVKQTLDELGIGEMLDLMEESLVNMIRSEIDDAIHGVRGKQTTHIICFSEENSENE
ncbi:MAG: hypothetical protein K0Q73_552 [Paenibacillus sp.]|jgi:hypothetical protein|nr:hypothetical protein [Paenibacillus sp.]